MDEDGDETIPVKSKKRSTKKQQTAVEENRNESSIVDKKELLKKADTFAKKMR